MRTGRQDLDLTPREFGVLRYRLTRVGGVVTKQELLDHVWRDTDGADINGVEVYIGLPTPKGRHPIRSLDDRNRPRRRLPGVP